MSENLITVGSVVTIDAEKLRDYLARRDNYSQEMRVFAVDNGKVFISKNTLWYSKNAVKRIMETLTSDIVQSNGSRLITWRGMEALAIKPKGIEIFPVSAHNLKVVETLI